MPPIPPRLRAAGALPAAVIASVVAAYALLPGIVNANVCGIASVVAGRPLTVGSFTVLPLPGWSQDRGRSVDPLLTLRRGGVRITFVPQDGTRTPDGLYAFALRRFPTRTPDARPVGLPVRAGLSALAVPTTGSDGSGTLAVVHSADPRVGLMASIVLAGGADAGSVADARRMVQDAAVAPGAHA